MPSSTPKYAEGTKVSPEKSQSELQILLRKYGVIEIGTMTNEDHAAVGFKHNQRLYKIILAYPDLKAFRMAGNRTRTQDQQRAARDQEIRRLWRALVLVIKAKLEAVQSEIVAFEEEFLSHLVVNGEQTLYQWIQPKLDSNSLYLPPPKEAE